MLIPSEQLCVVHSGLRDHSDRGSPVNCSSVISQFQFAASIDSYRRAKADLPTLPKVSKLHILLAAQISETC
jgi:hypothetical protein